MTPFRFLIPLALATTLLVAATSSDAIERLRGPSLKGNALTTAAESMWRDLDQATWIRDGQSKHVMYVFFDPNCPYCRKVYEGLRTQVEFNEVELRWIPVGILMATSLGKAASILEAKDPEAAFHLNEHRFTTGTGAFGGIEEEPAPRPETLERLNRNLALLRRSGRDAVPSLLYRDQSGQTHFVLGAPPPAALERIVKNLE